MILSLQSIGDQSLLELMQKYRPRVVEWNYQTFIQTEKLSTHQVKGDYVTVTQIILDVIFIKSTRKFRASRKIKRILRV